MPYRIAHISDLHIESEPETRYPGVIDTLEKNRVLLIKEAPDLIVVTGDLTSYGSADPNQLQLAKQWLDSIGIPYLAIPGNHDLGANRERHVLYGQSESYEDCPWSTTHFASVFNQPPVIHKDLGTFQIIAMAIRENDPDHSLNLLRQQLQQNSKPGLLFGHYPLQTIHQNGVLATFGYSEFIPNIRDALWSIVTEYPQIQLYGCGHVHASSITRLSSTCQQFTAGGLGPGPCQWWLYEVFDDRLEFQSKLGSGPQTFWEKIHPNDPLLNAAYQQSSVVRGTLSFKPNLTALKEAT